MSLNTSVTTGSSNNVAADLSITDALKSYRICKFNSLPLISTNKSHTHVLSTNKEFQNEIHTTNLNEIEQKSMTEIKGNNAKQTDVFDIDNILEDGDKIALTKTTPAPKPKKRLRKKLKDFNNIISCSLCHGYLINATTIDNCIHSFCRSCIVKSLKENKKCPQCGDNSKELSLSNLRSDESLKALVYKLVPGLHQKECERQFQFNSEKKACDLTEIEEEEYFSPVEPISLSLEYYPESLQLFSKNAKLGHIPPVRFLQCPAAVTIHHLKRFIYSKFDMDPGNQRVDIYIIYDDEILPTDYSLMDVGYIFSWKRTAPMRFFYQILVRSTLKKIIKDAPCDKAKINDISIDVKRKKNNEGTIQKSVRFKDDSENINNEPKKSKYTVFKSKSLENAHETKYILNKNNNNNCKLNNKLVAVNVNDNNINQQCSVRIENVVINNESKVVSSQLDKTLVQNKTANDGNEKVTSSTQNSDFKSLRSNDVRFNEFSTMKTSEISKLKNNGSRTKIVQTIAKSSFCETPQKPVLKCDIVVSIPQVHLHRTSNSSDDSFENLSLAQLKTANKKGAVSPKDNCIPFTNGSEQQKTIQEIPKLKIDLPRLKTKFSLPKNIVESEHEMKKNFKIRKLSAEEVQPSTHNVDITTYAKVIGLKPIKPIIEEKRDLISKSSPDDSPVSATSSSGTSSVFAFTSDVMSSNNTSHKKRKKAKHSKATKDGKRRKLHAEISSQPADESLKFKLKLTGTHKVHKSERKALNEDLINNLNPFKTVNNNDIEKVRNDISKQNKNIVERKPTKTHVTKPNIENLRNKLAEENFNNNNNNSNNLNKTKTTTTIKNQNDNSINQNKSRPSYIQDNIKSQSLNNFPSTNSKCNPLTSVSVTNTITSISSIQTTNSAQKIIPKPLSQQVMEMQNPKLPVSPPLPPSLFKTTPMPLQTMPLTLAKPIVQARMQFQNSEIRQQIPTPILHRKTPYSRTAANFVVPNPPRGIASSAPKSYPINSIASAAHRQAAQFKRSASLDSSPPTLTKQLKIEQDRLIRKAAFASMTLQPTVHKTIASNNLQMSQKSKLNMKKTISPPVVTSSISSKSSSSMDQYFYTSAMSPTYTHENIKIPIHFPPSTVGVTKLTETFAPNLNHPSGLTITPQSQLQMQQPFQFQQSQKPALEIVRISSNIPPADQQKLMVTNNNTIKQNIPKTTRPTPPPIPLVKIKRSLILSQANKPQISKVIEKIPENIQNVNTQKSSVDGGIQVLDLSGKSPRSPAKEHASSPGPTTKSNSPTTKETKSITGNSLEAALNKLKQQQSPYNKSLITSSQVVNSNEKISNSTNEITNSIKDTPSGLQNLQLLSDSATNREKITINAQRTLPKLPKLNEISKMRGNATVRQQNASIRNIPNPSALVCRSNQPVPMLASITKTSSPPKINLISSTQTTTIAATTSSQKSAELIHVSSSPILITSAVATSNLADTSKLIASKKNLHLEQLAANLNMRAAAAADNTAKTAAIISTPESTQQPTSTTATEPVNSSSTSNANSSIEQYPKIPLKIISTSSPSSVTTSTA